jgi:hypothetical protein
MNGPKHLDDTMRPATTSQRAAFATAFPLLVLLSAALSAAPPPVRIDAVGDWRVRVTVQLPDGQREAELDVPPADVVAVVDERHATLANFDPAGQPVFVSYRHGLRRLDSIVLAPDGSIVLLPATVRRLRSGEPLTVLAWGGRNTGSYLAEPPGSEHNYREKVLERRPHLVISEFVNDANLSPEQVEERYGRLLGDFRGIDAEWIILTPHYVMPSWMGLESQREIDDDPRPYVKGVREFGRRHGVAVADASLRYGRLWRRKSPRCGRGGLAGPASGLPKRLQRRGGRGLPVMTVRGTVAFYLDHTHPHRRLARGRILLPLGAAADREKHAPADAVSSRPDVRPPLVPGVSSVVS